MIKNSCKDVKFCAICDEEIWSGDKRKVRNNGSVVHLKGQCPNVMNRPPGNDNPVVGVDSIEVDNRKLVNFIGLIIAIILIVAGVKDVL